MLSPVYNNAEGVDVENAKTRAGLHRYRGG